MRGGWRLVLTGIASVSLLASGAGAVLGADDTLRADLRGAAVERPDPGDPNGTGQATMTFKAGEICWEIDAAEIELPGAAAHIHTGGAGVAGPVLVTLSPPDASGHSEGCVAADEATQAEIKDDPAGYYVNVHTSDFPGGAIRGQLQSLPPTDAASEAASAIGGTATPTFILLTLFGVMLAVSSLRRFAVKRLR